MAMEQTLSRPVSVTLIILACIAAPFLALAYVSLLGRGWRMFMYIHGAILFFAGLAIFMRDAKSFLLFILVFAASFGFGRHFVYEKMPFESVLFASGIRIDTVDVILIVLYAQWILSLGTTEKSAHKLTAGGWLGALFAAWLVGLFIVTLTVAKEPRFGLYESFVISKGFLLFFYLVNNVKTRRDFKIIVYALLAMAFVQSFYLTFQFVTKTSYTIYGQAAGTGEPGVFRSRGFFGSFDNHVIFLATILPIYLSAFLVYPQPLRRLIALGSMLIIVFGTTATRARIALASIAISTVIVLIMSYRRRRIAAHQLAIMLMVCFMVALMFLPLVYQRFVAAPYGEDRGPLMATAISMIFDHLLLGVGPNNYNFLVQEYVPVRFRGTWEYTVHNEYLLRIAETGLLVAGLYYGMIILAIRKFFLSTWSQDRLIYSVSVGLFSALLASIPHRYVSIYHHEQYFVLFSIVMSLAYVIGRLSEEEPS